MGYLLTIVLNYLFILASILVFVSPFYLAFRKYRSKPYAAKSINREIEDFFESKQANWLVLFWAFGEALFWYVIPEFLLFLIIFLRVHRKRDLLIYDIYGTLAGSTLAYFIKLPVRLISNFPYVHAKMVTQAESWYKNHGLLGLFYQPLSGVPYKVFTYLAPHYHYFILLFLLVAVIVRIARYYILFAMFYLSYPVLHKFVYQHYVRLFFIAVFIFSVLLLRVYDIYNPHYHVTALDSKPALNVSIAEIYKPTTTIRRVLL